MRRTIALFFFALLIPALLFAIKTSQVEFGENGSYDGRVKIYRDDAGLMFFKDESLTSPIALNQIGAGNRAHGNLSGLGNDDHPQYLSGSRHSTIHAGSFNNLLPAGPDHAGNTTIGGHMQDEDIHISRALTETIVGAWKFDVQPEFMANIKLSQHGDPGKMDISFENGATDARLRWDNVNNRFEFNNTVYAPHASFDALIASGARFSGDVLGSLEGSPPSGRIADFVTIEGIASENLLDKSANETVSGSWSFLNNTSVNYGNLILNSDADYGGKKVLKMRWYDNPDFSYFKIDPLEGLFWGEGESENYDTQLYRSSSGVLDTNGVFASHATLWKDWAVAAAGNGSYFYDDMAAAQRGWIMYYMSGGDYHHNETHLRSTSDGDLFFTPIPFGAGTVLTRLRVKWQALGTGDGVMARLIKRDESGSAAGWTVVGAQQTYTDAGSPFDVTVSAYDFADETMGAGYSYSIEVESEVVAAGVKLFAVGVETSKRVF